MSSDVRTEPRVGPRLDAAVERLTEIQRRVLGELQDLLGEQERAGSSLADRMSGLDF